MITERLVYCIALLTFAIGVALLAGCAGSKIEVRGFRPEATAQIMSLLEAKKGFCTDGVAGERRSASVTVTPPDPRYYNAQVEVRTNATKEFRCR